MHSFYSPQLGTTIAAISYLIFMTFTPIGARTINGLLELIVICDLTLFLLSNAEPGLLTHLKNVKNSRGGFMTRDITETLLVFITTVVLATVIRAIAITNFAGSEFLLLASIALTANTFIQHRSGLYQTITAEICLKFMANKQNKEGGAIKKTVPESPEELSPGQRSATGTSLTSAPVQSNITPIHPPISQDQNIDESGGESRPIDPTDMSIQ